MNRSCLAFSVALSLALASAGRGAVILQPASVSTGMGAVLAAGQVVDQSGLSVGYTSMVTDFDSYVASHPSATATTGSVWTSSQGTRAGNFDLSFGTPYVVDAIAFWNLGTSDPSAIQTFTITLSNDPSFAVSTIFTGFTAGRPGTGQAADVQVFNFAPTSASYLRLGVVNTWSPTSFGTGFNEIGVRVVPEPGSVWLLGTGALLWAGRRGRKGQEGFKLLPG